MQKIIKLKQFVLLLGLILPTIWCGANNSYSLDSDEFEGITPEEIENSDYVDPDAVEGLLHDLEKGRTAGLVVEELEEVLPEAVRHDPSGLVGINYNAIVTVLVEAFKEQQTRIDQLESILRENGLLNGKK